MNLLKKKENKDKMEEKILEIIFQSYPFRKETVLKIFNSVGKSYDKTLCIIESAISFNFSYKEVGKILFHVDIE